MKQFITYILLFSSAFVLAQKAQFANAKLDAATVYFNSAELTHYFSANLNKGTNEIVVKNVANRLNENTLRIVAPKNVRYFRLNLPLSILLMVTTSCPNRNK